MQALLGATLTEDLAFRRADPAAPSRVVETEIDTLPTFGIIGQRPLLSGPVAELGFEGGLLVSWWDDRAMLDDGGSPSLSLRTDVVLTELLVGPFANLTVADAVRLYVGGGPQIGYGYLYSETEVDETSDSSFRLGVYARGGVEVSMGDGSYFGLGAKWTRSELDFDAVGDVDFDGLQVLLTYTQTFGGGRRDAFGRY